MTSDPVRILLADDHAVMRRGLRLLLDSEPDFEVVGEAGDGASAVELAVAGEVDVALLDLTMPGMGGIEATAKLRRRMPAVRTLILSMHDDEESLFDALHAGASGYVLKSVADRELVEAIRATVRGESFLFPKGAKALVDRYLGLTDARARSVHDPLTPREVQVVQLVAEGLSTREIAERLTISVKTVERHRTNIFDKLDVRDRVELTRYAIRRGLVAP